MVVKSYQMSCYRCKLVRNMNVFSVFLLIFCTLTWSQCAKILGVFSTYSPSHYFLGTSLMQELANRGHEVTIISPFTEKNPSRNGTYREIVLAGFSEENEERRKRFNMFNLERISPFLVLPFLLNVMNENTENILKHPNVQELLKSGETFDVVIVEQFMNEALKGFATHFSAPLIVFNTGGTNTWLNMLIGNPTPPSYVSDPMLGYYSHMTFWERTVNTLMHIYSYSLYHLYYFPKQEKIFNQHFPNGSSFYDVLYNSSLVLLNSHPSINQPVPYVPNMIDIGGFHIQPPKKLPTDLQKFLDEAKEGVVYFSLGSNWRSSELPPEKRDSFLEAFSKLKEKVLWKWEQDVLPGQPKNVDLGKWWPQQEILAHPNVKLFISHGGLLSSIETVYHGVPVLTIPLLGDQSFNAQRFVNEGLGLSLSFKDISEENLTRKLRELLNNTKYAQNAKERSQFFRDRLVNPIDTATYWVEYVIRHKGAPNLRAAGIDLPWYQYLLLDVIVFVSVLLLLIFYTFYKLVHMYISWCLRSKNRKMKQS